MKKVSLRFLVIALITLFSLGNVDAAKPISKPENTTIASPPPPEVQKLIDRVYEIQHMDRSKMTVAEKKELKSELKGVKKQLKAVEAVYIPVGTAIIILILLLLLL